MNISFLNQNFSVMSNNKTTKLQVLEREVIEKNKETGDQETVRQEFTRIVEQDKFIQTYIDGVKGILQLEKKTDIRVLIALWEMAEWNTNKLVLVKPIKIEIAERLGYRSEKMISNSIQNLVRKNILVRQARSVYYIHPKLFFKGTRDSRNKMIEVVLKIKVK